MNRGLEMVGPPASRVYWELLGINGLIGSQRRPGPVLMPEVFSLGKCIVAPAEACLDALDITQPNLVSAGHIAPILTAKLPNRSRGCDHRLCQLARSQSIG